jgi:hypothetical protein
MEEATWMRRTFFRLNHAQPPGAESAAWSETEIENAFLVH